MMKIERVGVVFGLGDGSAATTGPPGTGDDHDLGRTGIESMAQSARARPAADVAIAGSDDLVDAGDRLGAVGERRDGMSAADPQGLVTPASSAAAITAARASGRPQFRGRHPGEPPS